MTELRPLTPWVAGIILCSISIVVVVGLLAPWALPVIAVLAWGVTWWLITSE